MHFNKFRVNIDVLCPPGGKQVQLWVSNDALRNDTKCEAIDRGLGISNFQNLHFDNEDTLFFIEWK